MSVIKSPKKSENKGNSNFWNCPRCQTHLNLSNKFCIKCGTPMPEFVAQKTRAGGKVDYYLEGSSKLRAERMKRGLSEIIEANTTPQRLTRIGLAALAILALWFGGSRALRAYVDKREKAAILKTGENFYYHLAQGDVEKLLDEIGYPENPQKDDLGITVADEIETIGEAVGAFKLANCSVVRHKNDGRLSCEISYEVDVKWKDSKDLPRAAKQGEKDKTIVKMRKIQGSYVVYEAKFPGNLTRNYPSFQKAIMR